MRDLRNPHFFFSIVALVVGRKSLFENAMFARRRMHRALLFAGLVFSTRLAVAISSTVGHPTPPKMTIVRKAGREDGIAGIVLNGKVRKLTPRAVAAWPVKAGEGALILLLQKKGSGQKQYMLRYYDLDSGKRHSLGEVPLNAGSVHEWNGPENAWAFALSGKEITTGNPITLIGTTRAMPGRIPEAKSPRFGADTMTYMAMPGGATQTVKIAALLGTDLQDIYARPEGAATWMEYLQIFPNATAMTVSPNGVIHKGHWQTDGRTLHVYVDNSKLSIPQDRLHPVKGVPAGTRFSVRLLQPLSSRTAKEGLMVKAVLIGSVVVDGEIFIPSGSAIEGTVMKAHGVGWGFKHETAALTIDWNRVTLRDGHTLPITARVFQVENSQEKVDAKGKIQGIRSTGTPGHSVENGVLSFAGIDPIAYIFAQASGAAVLGFAEPEILYTSGTELILEYVKPLITSQTFPPSVHPSADSTEERAQLQDFVKSLPFRTKTQGTDKVSDLTNLVFLGSPDAVERAFTASGWHPSEVLTAGSTFRTIKTVSGNQVYTQAPMSVLLLDGQAPLLTLSKTTDTFSSRHHLRIFSTGKKWDGQTALTASSTQDIGIGFSRKKKTFIHIIDQHIDNERSKVINDLKFTRCVESIDMVPRPWVPMDAYNSTGDRLLTDGQIAVVHINSCENPLTTPAIAAPAPNRFERSTRDTALTIRDSLWRGNLIYQGIAGGIKVHNYLRDSNELPEDSGAWRKTDASGTQYRQMGSGPHRWERRGTTGFDLGHTSSSGQVSKQDSVANHKWDPPHYEFALEGGYLHFRETDLSFEAIFLSPNELNQPYYELDLYDQVGDGWTAGGSVTVNSWRHFSNEFSYFRQQGKYQLFAATYKQTPENPDNENPDLSTQPIGIVTRQFEYNVLAQLRPPTSRWRPYAAAGPVFQLISLVGSPLKKPAGPYTLGLKNIGLIQAAFDFGGTPPLDGGGIFQFGLQYGGGMKYRIAPHMIVRADYRETWSKNPNIIANSYDSFEPIDVIVGSYTTDVVSIGPRQKFFQDRFTLGVAFCF